MPMETAEILHQFERYTGKFERAAVEAAVARREEVTPELLRILEDTVDRAAQLDAEGGFMAHLYAMFLLAQFRETRAFGPGRSGCIRALLDGGRMQAATVGACGPRSSDRPHVHPTGGLRPEEMFALRRDDVQGDQLRIDEALVEGESAPTKTEASDDYVYIPPDLAVELDGWLACSSGGPADWLFQTDHGRRGFLNANNYRNRILKPAAIRAAVGVIDTGKRDEQGKPILKTDVDFRALHRTCATLFGDRAKDPKSTQAQLRHADPTITLKHYQKAIPASVKATAVALENDLTGNNSERVLSGSIIQ